MNKEEIRSKIEELGPWYHNIELNGLETKKVSPPPGTPERLMNHPEERWRIVREFLPENGGSVVDLGCNAGGISFKLEDYGYEVTGVEIKSQLYEQALFAKEVLDSKVNFVQADAVGFLVESRAFDYSVALGLVYHLREPEKFLKVLGEKTRKMFLVESSWHDVDGRKWVEEEEVWHLSREWLRNEVKKTGISQIYTATKADDNLPDRGFRFLVAGRFEQ